MVGVPLPVAIFTILLVHKVRSEIRRQAVQDMEMPKEHECESPDSTELHLAMSDDTVFIHMPVLVVLCIVCKGCKDLRRRHMW